MSWYSLSGSGPAIARRWTLTRLRASVIQNAAFMIACIMLIMLILVYSLARDGVFSVAEVNADASTAIPLLLAATGQTIVLLRRGIDLSIGGMISLGTVLAATHFAGGATTAGWSIAVLAIGSMVGILNGALIFYLRLQPFLVTLATWSVLGGIALMILPTDGGKIPDFWTAFGNSTALGLQTSVWLLIVLAVFWWWFRQTRLGTTIRATGSDEKSVFLSGIRLPIVNIATYGLSGFFAALSSLVLTMQTATGSPTVGNGYVLQTVAAAVIGGVSIFGGRGGLAGTMIGAFILVIIGNLVFVLQVSSLWQPILSGVILLIAVLGGSFAERATSGAA